MSNNTNDKIIRVFYKDPDGVVDALRDYVEEQFPELSDDSTAFNDKVCELESCFGESIEIDFNLSKGTVTVVDDWDWRKAITKK